MTTKLNQLKCEDTSTVTPEHNFHWNDQSSQSRAPLVMATGYATFTGASFTVTGDTNTNTTIDGITTNTGRVTAGMPVAGPGIPAQATVASITDATSFEISDAATATSSGETIALNGILTLTLTGSVSVTNGETITQAVSNATGIVATGTGSVGTLSLYSITGTFDTTNTLSGSTSGALGANSVPTSLNGGVQTLDVIDPVLSIGYNRLPNGNSINANEAQMSWQMEAHYDRGASGDAWMECFLTVKGVGAGAPCRPFFFAYDKEANKPVDVEISPGTGYDFVINHEDTNGAAASPTLTVGESDIVYRPQTAGADARLLINSVSGSGSNIYMGADGDSADTYPRLRIRALTSGTNTNIAFSFYDNNTTPGNKSGALTFIAPTWANTALMTLGASSAASHSMFTVTAANGTVTNLHCQTLICIANQSVSALVIDGTNNAGAVEAEKYQIFPKGYVSVKPSGGAVTSPQTGANAVTSVTFGAFPGAATTGDPDMWFPMLDTAGALYYVPGWSA